MYLAYSTNPHLPRVRMQAVRLVQQGWSTRQVARHFGFDHSTVVRWVNRSLPNPRARTIPTRSSRPHTHPASLSRETVQAIMDYRIKYRRCAEVIHHLLIRDGYDVSLSSVKRTLKREGFIKTNPWKRLHQSQPRPSVVKPGSLVEIDVVHRMKQDKKILYVYTLLDVFSRWSHAVVTERINTHRSLMLITTAQRRFPQIIQTIQSDHGSEFSTWFTEHIQKRGISHRHTRVRKPTDNGHVERFNRTIQEECLDRVPTTLKAYRKAIPEYINFYNIERPHLSLNMKTPLDVVRSY